MASKLFISAKEVAKELEVSDSYAYRLIRQLNAELEQKGFVVVKGKISRKYFEERVYGMNEIEIAGGDVLTVIKNKKSNTYEVRTYYKDWTGVRKQKTKRGFKRKCDAQEWERAFKLKENLSLDMYFEDFVDLYLNDIKSRIKYNTWLTKKTYCRKKRFSHIFEKEVAGNKTFRYSAMAEHHDELSE